MSPESFDQFLTGAMGLCAVMAVLNLLLIKRRGTSAYLMSTAFLSLGLAMFLLRNGASQLAIGAAGFATFCLLVGDFVLRAGKRPERKGQ